MKKILIGALLLICFGAYVASVYKTQDFGGTQVGPGILPNPTLTPGATNPAVTQANIHETICTTGWTATIRPPSSYTTGLKVAQILQYGYADKKTADYELDHFLSLELGGNPTSALNLWPEKYVEPYGAHDKDKLENALHSMVCSGQMSLADAQRVIKTDWVAEYQKLGLDKPAFGATNSSTDPDDD